jgi:hypothetical protein
MTQGSRRSSASLPRTPVAIPAPTIPSADVGPDGSIRWAEVLVEPEMLDLRRRIEEGFRWRASTGQMTLEVCAGLLRDCQDVGRSLIERKRSNAIDQESFTAGWNCLAGLQRDIRISQARCAVR